MGINYMAQVEVYFEPTIDSNSGWQAVSRWELQKDYGFTSAFFTIAEPDWPDDADNIIGEELCHRDVFSGKRHTTGSKLVGLMPSPSLNDSSNWFIWAIELREHVRRLIPIYPVRILLWQA